MKKSTFAILLCMSFNCAFAQISFIGKTTSKEEAPPVIYKYDSLQNIQSAVYKDKKYNEEVDFYGHLIGQTLIYVGKYSHDEKDRSLKREVTNGTGKRAYTTYEIAIAPEIGTEFTVIDVSPKRTSSSFLQKIIIQNVQTEEKYIYDPSTYFRTDEWVVKGFYEKMKQLYVGNIYYYINAYPSYNTDFCMFNLETDEMMGTIDDFSIWKCVDVSIKVPQYKSSEDDNKSKVVLVFEDEKGIKYYSYLEGINKKPLVVDYSTDRKLYGAGDNLRFIDVLSEEFQKSIKYQILYADINEKEIFLGKFLNEEQYQKLSESLTQVENMKSEKVAAAAKAKEDAKKRAAARKSNLIKKYGETIANDMLKGYVRIGWTKEMCIEAWGRPKDINKTTGSYGVHEQWVYGGGNYLYFENGKLTSIQN